MEDVRSSMKGFDEVIDFMQEDDDLIAPSADPFLDSETGMNEFDFSESMKGLTLGSLDENDMGRQQFFQPSDSELKAENRNRKCNLRKSLAWDSAFFTSAGVLDPEELSSMIGGSEIGWTKVLPGIPEDDMRSSVSTLDSDTLTLESLEAELFQDIRASIQKSNKVSASTPPNDMSCSKEDRPISIPSSTMTHHTSERKAKLAVKNTHKKLLISASETLNKKNLRRSEVIQGNLDVRCKVTSLSRPMLPHGPGKLSTLPPPAKSHSENAYHNANEKGAVRVAPLVKLSASSKPEVPRPTMTSKVSVLVSSKGLKEHSIATSSAEISACVASNNAAKLDMDCLENNIGLKTTKPAASSSTVVVPSHLSAYVKSKTTSNSSISSSSSIGEWSIESSSSTTTVNQRPNSQRACAEAAPLSGAKGGDDLIPFDSQVQSRDCEIGNDPNSVTRLSNNFTKKNKMRSSLPHPAAAKPSGLRMPSPKIGFFDGVKSHARSPKWPVQSNRGMPCGIEKGENICTPIGGLSNSKTAKVQPRTFMSSQNKGDDQPAASILKPVSHIHARKLSGSRMRNPSSLTAAIRDPTSSLKLEKAVSMKAGGKVI